MKPPRGFSLLETLIGLFLMFVMTVFLMALFAGGYRTFDRSLELTTGTFLAQQEMEELLNINPVTNQSGSFSGAYDNYTYTVTATDYNLQLQELIVTVTGPHGVISQLTTLKDSLDFAGIATDAWSSTATFRRQADMQVDSFVQATSLFSSTPSLPNSGTAAGIAVDDQDNVAFVADRKNHELWYYDPGAPGGPWMGPYAPASNALGLPTGVATDEFASTAWVADATHNKIWYYDTANNSWRSTAPTTAPLLGSPAGLATDAFSDTVWVVDATNQCVREYDDSSGTWSPTQYGLGQLQTPRGIALAHDASDAVYVVDSVGLWMINTTPAPVPTPTPAVVAVSEVFALPAGVKSASGLAVDAQASSWWINDPLGNTIWFTTATSSQAIPVPTP